MESDVGGRGVLGGVGYVEQLAEQLLQHAEVCVRLSACIMSRNEARGSLVVRDGKDQQAMFARTGQHGGGGRGWGQGCGQVRAGVGLDSGDVDNGGLGRTPTNEF